MGFIVGSTVLYIYIGNGVGSDRLSENVTLANRVSGACWTGGGGQERKKVDFRSGCSDVKQPRNRRPPAGVGSGDVKKNEK